MGLDEKTEKRHKSGRYVKQNLGLWSGWKILPWYYRLALVPFYAMHTVYYCLKGVPVNFQILHDKNYEPDEEGLMKCPQCQEPLQREIDLDFTVGQNDSEQ